MARRVATTVLIATMLVIVFPHGSVAAPPQKKTEEASPEDLEELLRIVSEETDLATRTKMNRDYVPGILTVLDGDTLEALGCRTVLDALSLVPGMQTFRELSGAPNLSVRGIAFPFNAGNTKVLINSVSISREDAGINSAALLTPIEQVERIEIVRGPSSSIHGAFAFAGLINIVTRNSGRKVFAGASGDGHIGGGYLASTVGKWRFSVSTAPYAGTKGEGPLGTRPDASGSTSVLSLENGGFSLKAQYLRRDQDTTPTDTNIEESSFERSTGMEARQRFTLSPVLRAEARLDYLDDAFTAPSVGKHFKGNVMDGAASLQWRPNRQHDVLAEVELSRSHIGYATLLLPAAPLPPLLRTNLTDTDRHVSSLTLQDQIELGERLSLTLGLRHDHYDDVGGRTTPRAALVYRATDSHIFKAQYSEGFRPPTFWELYAPGVRDPNLNFEVMRTAELGYVYHRPQTVARLTLFHSKIDDMLYLVLPPPGPGPTIFANNTRARMDGAELELERQESERFRWLGNVSYVHTNDGRSTSGPSGDSAAAADWLGNLAAIYRPLPRVVVALRLLHVGTRHTIDGKTNGYDSLDLTTSLVIASNWTLRAGVRNLLNDDITYLLALPNATQQAGFATRTVWTAVSRRF